MRLAEAIQAEGKMSHGLESGLWRERMFSISKDTFPTSMIQSQCRKCRDLREGEKESRVVLNPTLLR